MIAEGAAECGKLVVMQRRQRYSAGWITKEYGSWLGHYNRRVLDPLTGQTKRRQIAFKIANVADLSKAQAMRLLRERVEQELGLRPDSRSTVAWFIANRWKPLREATWRDSTRATNEGLLKIITTRFGQHAIEDMDQVEMQAWINSLSRERSASVVRHCRIFLRSIMAEAEEQDFVRKNPARLLRVPVLKPTTKAILTPEQIKKLLEAAKFPSFTRDRVLLRLLLVTALRPSELFALRWKCFNQEWDTLILYESVYRGKIRNFTKTTQEGDTENVSVAIPKSVSLALMEWLYHTDFKDPEDFIFPDTNGGFLWKENWQRRVLTPLALLAGIDKVNFQMLRRSTATHAQKFGSLKDISTILRHKSTEMAQRVYIQSIDSTVRSAVESLADTLLIR